MRGVRGEFEHRLLHESDLPAGGLHDAALVILSIPLRLGNLHVLVAPEGTSVRLHPSRDNQALIVASGSHQRQDIATTRNQDSVAGAMRTQALVTRRSHHNISWFITGLGAYHTLDPSNTHRSALPVKSWAEVFDQLHSDLGLAPLHAFYSLTNASTATFNCVEDDLTAP